ncbi:MAG TPA: hypothetical protein PKY56_03015 [Candidatus Kapabacteria bacterium]|nr:hypothetical protein [Candidatus Kapabacteria bacterium]
MRKKLILFIILSAFIFNSCNDIVDSDKNILKTKIQYKYLLEDQEKSVIMPLKVGNVWYYDVAEYNTNGDETKKYQDSIFISGIKMIGKEKWYITRFPMISDENIYLANTDVGLYVRCDCEDTAFLYAKYPNYQGEYLERKFNGILIDSAGNQIEKEIYFIKKAVKDAISTTLGEMNCINYIGTLGTSEDIINYKPRIKQWFKPDFGLAKSAIYHFNSEKPEIVYSIIESIESNDDCQFEINENIPRLLNNENNSWSVELKNESTSSITLTSAFVESESQTGSTTISNSFDLNLPIILHPGESVNLDLNIFPIQTGAYNSTIKVMSNDKCIFYITLNGNVF